MTVTHEPFRLDGRLWLRWVAAITFFCAVFNSPLVSGNNASWAWWKQTFGLVVFLMMLKLLEHISIPPDVPRRKFWQASAIGSFFIGGSFVFISALYASAGLNRTLLVAVVLGLLLLVVFHIGWRILKDPAPPYAWGWVALNALSIMAVGWLFMLVFRLYPVLNNLLSPPPAQGAVAVFILPTLVGAIFGLLYSLPTGAALSWLLWKQGQQEQAHEDAPYVTA